MLKIPLVFLGLGLVVFVFFVWIPLLVFSSPQCDRLANTTAYDLKVAIDEVSKDSFNSWSKPGEVPSDSDVDYYRSSPIMLCQDKGISYLETILGTTLEPQFKIYYERFPEGGGGTWTEAYPWSGGAAASLRIWEYMRIGTGLFQLTSAAWLMRGAQYSGFSEYLGGLAHNLRISMLGPVTQDIGDKVETLFASEGIKDLGDTSAYYIVSKVKGEEYLLTFQEALDNGIIKGATSDGLLVISDTPVNVMIPNPSSYINDEPTEFVDVFQHTDNNGKLIGLSTDVPSDALNADGTCCKPGSDWSNLKAKPSEMYNDYLDTLSPEERAKTQKIYTTADKVPFGTYINDQIKSTEYYQSFIQPTEDKINTFLKSLEDVGYETSRTVITDEGTVAVKKTLIDLLQDTTAITVTLDNGQTVSTTVKDAVSDMFLEQPGVVDKIKLTLGLATDAKITDEHLIKVLGNIKYNGFILMPDEMEFGFHQAAINEINNFKSIGSYTSVDSLFIGTYGIDPNIPATDFDSVTGKLLYPDVLKDADKYTVIQKAAQASGKTEYEVINKAFTAVNYDVWPAYLKNGAYDIQGLTEDSLKNYLTTNKGASDTSLIARYVKGEEEATNQVGLLSGTFEQNKGSMPVTKVGYLGKVFKAEAKKIIYLDGPQNILNPDSFYDRLIFTSLGYQGCQGNSICLYSGGAAMESPFYLNETAKNFEGSIRVWRPVNIAEQWIGIQALIQHVPSNPRFYVVSPCLATAKIWKTTYNNQPTIFVYPEKVDVEGKASNYCYADSNLINQYYAVWTGSDVATIITAVTGFGVAGDAVKIISRVTSMADPITLTQSIIEGAISWPSWPFAALTSDIISANVNKIGIRELKKGETQE